jgi:UPF0755 protein
MKKVFLKVYIFAFRSMSMKRNLFKYFSAIILVLACTLLYAGLSPVFLNGIKPKKEKVILYIPTGATFNQVTDTLDKYLEITSRRLFIWIAGKKNYSSHIKPGKYLIKGKMSHLALINILRSGNQTEVKVTFNNIRNIFQLAGKVGGQIEADSALIALFLSDPDNYAKDGFTKETVISVFIPNTYRMYWNTSARGFYDRMLKEYRKFWTKERVARAASENLTPLEVSILASIIDDEVAKAEEKPRIAGVYINRLKRGMPLQACPTIKFALNDFTITRVLNKHLQVDSPYNTYKHKGFPPGPIGCPTVEGLEAVINYEKHDYLFFAAKADFSGYHNFSKTLAEHNRYANEYQRELDRRKIFK